MLYLRDFEGTERYKKAVYILYKNANGEFINDYSIISQICPILLWDDQSDGGVIIQLALYDEIPKGYKLWKDAPKAPFGYEWIYNGKPLNDGRCIGLLKLKIETKKYHYLEECNDFKCLDDYLTDSHLSEIENILIAYKTNKIDLVIPRDENDEIVWEGDWETTVIDSNYERTGSETLILKWYEGFEDTGYVINCFMEDDWNEKN